MKIEKEDLDAMANLASEILEKAQNMTLDALEAQTKGKIRERYINASAESMQDRKNCEKYSFYSENEINVALYLFFSNAYNAKRIARECYLKDEGDKIYESLYTNMPLGKVYLPNGGVVTGSEVEAVLRVRPYNNRNLMTGMPFDIITFRLIKTND